ncbi:NAD(P)-dependent dehydrogenase, short-chain alcohol dehydrogenase family [Sphingobium faniae]|nr:NAD(P)-dependent dehydrogenase, short-chain alcohol dehydrogenase family [Sphingobium faniae]
MKGRCYTVTGAGTGLGKATALLLARKGAFVVVAGLDRAAGEQTVAEIKAAGGEATYVQTDISKESDCARMVQAALDRYGRLDGAVNNAAAATIPEKMHLKSIAHWQQVIDVNLTGTFLCMKHQVVPMLAAGGGAIVNVSSVSGIRGYDVACDYGASKGGIISLSMHGAAEYGPMNIRVNALLPGPMPTPMLEEVAGKYQGVYDAAIAQTMLGRISETTEVAEAAAWLLSDAASYVTGASLSVDGGMSASAISRIS